MSGTRASTWPKSRPTIRTKVTKGDRRRFVRTVAKARNKDSLRALRRLTERISGDLRIASRPPILVPIEEVAEGHSVEEITAVIEGILAEYRGTLDDHSRAFAERYHYVHAGRKVVGVGSVGTRAWIVLLLGRDPRDPLLSSDTTREAHKLLSAHSPDALSGGWVAYAALVAADTPEFAEALRDQVNSKKRDKNGLRGADAFLARLAVDPTYPRKLKGADEAVDRVLAMTASDVARVETLGEAFKTQAYAMQKTAWGKKAIGPGSKRLTEAASFAASRRLAPLAPLQVSMTKGVAAPALETAGDAWSPEWGAKTQAQGNTEANADVVIDRVLNLAARYAVGSNVNEKLVAVYAKNDHADQCLSMTELTLKQCIAATRTPYEEAFCLGEHGLNDVGGCLGWVAGAN